MGLFHVYSKSEVIVSKRLDENNRSTFELHASYFAEP